MPHCSLPPHLPGHDPLVPDKVLARSRACQTRLPRQQVPRQQVPRQLPLAWGSRSPSSRRSSSRAPWLRTLLRAARRPSPVPMLPHHQVPRQHRHRLRAKTLGPSRRLCRRSPRHPREGQAWKPYPQSRPSSWPSPRPSLTPPRRPPRRCTCRPSGHTLRQTPGLPTICCALAGPRQPLPLVAAAAVARRPPRGGQR